ncbi:MAG: tetratricopeptide repeat protein [Spirochaetes bacterium]|nr:tetratricopeptide repeat protein [Spirochaetota bacterium]
MTDRFMKECCKALPENVRYCAKCGWRRLPKHLQTEAESQPEIEPKESDDFWEKVKSRLKTAPMSRCQSCNAGILPDAKFCHECAATQSQPEAESQLQAESQPKAEPGAGDNNAGQSEAQSRTSVLRHIFPDKKATAAAPQSKPEDERQPKIELQELDELWEKVKSQPKGKSQQAKFEKAAELKKLAELGLKQLENQQDEEAVKTYSKAIELAPNDAGFYERRGIAYYLMRDYSNALEDLEKSNKIEPNERLEFMINDAKYKSQPKVAALRCQSCNAEIFPDTKFCGKCGAKQSQPKAKGQSGIAGLFGVW